MPPSVTGPPRRTRPSGRAAARCRRCPGTHVIARRWLPQSRSVVAGRAPHDVVVDVRCPTRCCRRRRPCPRRCCRRRRCPTRCCRSRRRRSPCPRRCCRRRPTCPRRCCRHRPIGAPDDVVVAVGAPDDVVAVGVVGAPDDVVAAAAALGAPDDVVVAQSTSCPSARAPQTVLVVQALPFGLR